MIRFKAFIYRFSNIFGLHIYLAQKEEQSYIEELEETRGLIEEPLEGIERGCWQAKHGFTTVWAYKQPFFKAIVSKIKHAFDFRSYK